MKLSHVLWVPGLWALFSPLPAQSAPRFFEDPQARFEVLFTNPTCADYPYATPIEANDGTLLTQKPKNAYCRAADGAASGSRSNSPQARLIEWIRDPATKEIFFSTLSFSNAKVAEALCESIQQRDVHVRFVLDSEAEKDASKLTAARKVLECQPKTPARKPELYFRGHTPGIGFGHIKLMLFNPSEGRTLRLVFSSGNMTAGITLHHENWNFVATSRNTYFAQTHLCLRDALLEHAVAAKEFKAFLKQCRAGIQAAPESDIGAYFIPGDGDGLTATIAAQIARSRSIRVAAHRFSYPKLMELLRSKMTQSPETSLKIVTDDDLYWVGTTGTQVGPNLRQEFKALTSLTDLGAQARWMETNHNERLLHHNKFIVFDDESVLTGAGNLTGDAFSKNLENFYWIQIPEVVRSYREQHEHLWEDLATPTEKMPRTDIKP